MKKTTLNAIVSSIAFFSFLVVAITGIILWLAIQFGQEAPLGIVWYTWSNVHTCFAVLFTALLGVHLALHWSYFKSRLLFQSRAQSTKKKRRD